jgi:hypothetical protein
MQISRQLEAIMLTHLIFAVSMFVALAMILILQFNAFRPLAAGLLTSPAPIRVPAKRRDGTSLHQAAVDAWENEGGAARRWTL